MQDIYSLATEIIDFRSFSNLWFWIVLAVFWSTTSHFVMGVPYDLIIKSGRNEDPQDEADLQTLVRINARRIRQIADTAGTWLVGFVAFNIVSLGMLGFVYGLEFFQAIFLLFAPMALVIGMTAQLAKTITQKRGDELRAALRKHRFLVQLIGMLAIFVTAMWGIAFNLHFSVLNS